MGNVSGRENGGSGGGDGVAGAGAGGGGGELRARSNGESGLRETHAPEARVRSADLMVPVVPFQGDGPPLFNQMRRNETEGTTNQCCEEGIPTLITWSYGGNNVTIEGSWDNWTSRKTLQRSGKDHTILLVLPSGIYHYKFIVDGTVRYIPDLPYEADEMGHVVNLLNVHDYIPENFEGVTEFEAPSSPESSYNQALPRDEDFAKDPIVVPPHLHLTDLGMENSDEAASSSTKPQHVVLNHLFIEKGWASQSVAALGLCHRFQSKYVTVVLYKPLKR